MTQFTITELSKFYDSNGSVSVTQISENNVVWTAYDSKGKNQIFLYNGEETIQLSSNSSVDNSSYQTNELSEIDPRIVVNPKIDGNRVVWQRFNMSDTTTSIMLATIDDTKSSSIPPRDRVAYPAGNRNQKLVTSLTIIILGLISLCCLKKLFWK